MWIRNTGIGLLTLFALLVSQHIYAQVEEKSDCVIKLEQAQTKYNQGRIQDVEPLISDCLNSDEFSKAEKSTALKLLTLSYIFLKENELAEESMLRLLQTNHEFVINEAIDPSEFINLYNKYRTEQLISIGVLGGLSIANPIITQLNSTQDLSTSRQSYGFSLGFRVSANAEYKLFDHWYANPELGFAQIAITKFDEGEKIASGGHNSEFNGELNFSIIEMPLMIQYQFFEGKFRPYATAGIVPQFYFSASYPGDVTSNSIEGSPEVSLGTVNLNNELNRFNLAATISGGIKLNVPTGFINARLRYSYGLLQVFKETSALEPSDPNLIWDLNESLDGFRLQDLTISVGYTYNIFIPKKLR